jgi:galactokinase
MYMLQTYLLSLFLCLLLIIRVATATFLEELFDLPRNTECSSVQKALRCQQAEHTFADTPCGIMDQYISSLGRVGNLLLIDCRSNTATLVPMGSGFNSPVMVVTNSNVKHELSGSEYPDRVKQCQQAVSVLSKHYPTIKALRDVTLQQLEHVKNELSEVVYRRARHVIGENQRTLDAVSAFQRLDYLAVGEYMTQSHSSLRDDYEVSCAELDFLVRCALEVPGVYGSRMTGGGFGGCTVTLVDRKAAKRLQHVLLEKYVENYNKKCDCYETSPSAGAGPLSFHTATIESDEGKPVKNWLHYVIPGAVAALSMTVALTFLLKDQTCCT